MTSISIDIHNIIVVKIFSDLNENNCVSPTNRVDRVSQNLVNKQINLSSQN